MRNPLRWSSTFPAVLLSLAGVIGVVAGVVSIRGSLTTTGSVTAAGSLNVAPSTSATGFDGRPAYTMDAGDPCPPLVDGGPPACDGSPAISIDAGPAPTPVVVAGSVSMLESAWDIDDKTARTIGWRLKTEGAAGDSSNAPTTKLLIQSTADNSTWTTRATIDMAGALAVTGAITGTTGTFSGDIEAAGGYLSICNAIMNDVAASGTKQSSATFVAQTNVHIRDARCTVSGTITAGSITCSVANESSALSGYDIVFTSADASNTRKGIAIPKATKTAQQFARMQCVGSADLAPSGSVDISCGYLLEH